MSELYKMRANYDILKFDDGSSEFDFLDKEVRTGTTIMAVEYDGGVILGADSRTTMGAYIANRFTDKLTKITDQIYCCRSGSAADTQAVADIVKYRLNLFKMVEEMEPSVYFAANTFRKILYDYRDRLSAGVICAGWDKQLGGQVYQMPLGGMFIREPCSIGGSGSSYITGFCDSNYRKDMPEEECKQFVLKAVTLAIKRDGSSGGCVRIAVINKDGVRKTLHLGNELPEI